jgi:hypothetical protein
VTLLFIYGWVIVFIVVPAGLLTQILVVRFNEAACVRRRTAVT